MKGEREKISVCIPVYNGQDFIENQIRSILEQLVDGDEIIVGDDFSTDSSLEIISRIDDKRIIVVNAASNKGLVRNLSAILSRARHKYIFLADQDDLWVPGRVDAMIEILKGSQKELVVGNASCINKESEYISMRFNDVYAKKSSLRYQNIIRIFLGNIAYNGCCMAMTTNFKDVVSPIPNFVESHDLWFALIANVRKSIVHIDQDVTFRRIHMTNVSFRKRSVYKKIGSRIIMIIMLLSAVSARWSK